MLPLSAEPTAPVPSSAFGQDTQILQPRCVTKKSCWAPNNIPEFSQVLQCLKSGACFNQRDKREPGCPTDLTTLMPGEPEKPCSTVPRGLVPGHKHPTIPVTLPPPALSGTLTAAENRAVKALLSQGHQHKGQCLERASLCRVTAVPYLGHIPLPCLWQVTRPYATHWLVPQSSQPSPGSPLCSSNRLVGQLRAQAQLRAGEKGGLLLEW